MGIALHQTEVELAYVQHVVVRGIGPGRQAAPRWNDAPMWDLHPGVVKIWMACWAALFLIFATTFIGTAHALFQLLIVALTGLAYFGLPTVMSSFGKQTADRPSLGYFLHSHFETGGGRLSGFETLVQVTMAPLALCFGAIMISVIIALARAGAAS